MNKLYKCLIYGGNASLSVLDTTELVQRATDIHGLDDASAVLLGEMLTAAAYMAGCLKNPRGAVSLTVKPSGGAVISVSGDADGHIRGYIEGAEGGLGGGTLTVIKDDGFYRPFVGVCELTGGGVSENLIRYFRDSEQIPTALSFGAEVKDGKVKAAGGVVIQLMPGHGEKDEEAAWEKAEALSDAAGAVFRHGAEGILREYFGVQPDGKGVYLSFPEYKCNCSRKKITGVIVPLGRAELESIIAEQGCVKVHCHYCNKDYTFTQDDVDKLFR